MGAKQEVMASNYETDTHTWLRGNVDWNIPAEAEEAAMKAAERLSRRYAGVLELDDAKQDALMHLAERPEMVKHFLSTKGLGAKAIYRSIYGTVGDRYARLAGRVDRHTSIDDEMEAGRL